MTDLKDRVAEAAREEKRAYAGEADRPLGGYLVAIGVYAAGVLGLGALARATGRALPERLGAWDVFLLTAATHKLSRLLTKDAVTSPLRAPFTRYQKPTGEAEVMEQVRGTGVRHAIGGLVSCPFCTGMWVATGFTLVFAPRATRLGMAALTALAGSDFLQLAYDRVKP